MKLNVNEGGETMGYDEIRATVLLILTEDLFTDVENKSICDDQYLEPLGMDSYTFVKMIVRIEEVFGIEIPSDLLLFSKWRTVGLICEQLAQIVK